MEVSLISKINANKTKSVKNRDCSCPLAKFGVNNKKTFLYLCSECKRICFFKKIKK